MKKFSFLAFLVALSVYSLVSCSEHRALVARGFADQWVVEAEDTIGTQVLFLPSFNADRSSSVEMRNMVHVRSSKGVTIWNRQKLEAPVVVEYDAMIVVESESDRLSDLNCFWMATDPSVQDSSIWSRFSFRQGNFLRSYSLSLYYVGYGGNHNRTTRFRRYDGDERGIRNKELRPAILTEYTDSAHLLQPNHWYHIRIECDADGRTTYDIDGERIVDFVDEHPHVNGWFGFRTTLSQACFANFKVSKK